MANVSDSLLDASRILDKLYTGSDPATLAGMLSLIAPDRAAVKQMADQLFNLGVSYRSKGL